MEKFGPAKYQFQRGRIDACLIHHIDDFDVCGPTEAVKDLLENQLEKNTPLMVVVAKPNDKHAQNILGKPHMENANPGVLPGRKLQLTSAGSMGPLTIEEKETYASCLDS